MSADHIIWRVVIVLHLDCGRALVMLPQEAVSKESSTVMSGVDVVVDEGVFTGLN